VLHRNLLDDTETTGGARRKHMALEVAMTTDWVHTSRTTARSKAIVDCRQLVDRPASTDPLPT